MLLFRQTQAALDHGISVDDAVGLIPAFLSDYDPRGAVEQIHERYAHGGGWFDLKVGSGGFTMTEDGVLQYPEDPDLPALAEAWLHRDHVPAGNPPPERIIVHAGAFVSVHQPDGSFRVSRLD